MPIKIIALGDIVGEVSVDYMLRSLPQLKKEYGADLIIANAENASRNNGIEATTAQKILDGGVDIITTGNHVWRHRSLHAMLDDSRRIIRPANYPGNTPGVGFTVTNIKGFRILIMNLLGVVYTEPLASPFETADKILSENKGRFDFALVDIHAEATSEKLALAYYLDRGGKSGTRQTAAVWGTHTHVATADAKIMKGGTGYITDLGMCGGKNSVLGVKTELIIEKFLTKMPVKFETDEEEIGGTGAVFEIDPYECRTLSVKLISY